MSENLSIKGGSGFRETMWTNVFKIGGLQFVSWFQFLPYEAGLPPTQIISHKSDDRDPSAFSILSSHFRLQNEGFLSTWTNSFVGPWDPSQGVHNPDEKIKLWLFLPGCHSSVSESAQAAVSHLRVIASGVWSAPGDSEEVALALSQSLRNRIERSLRAFSYQRFGDVFTKCHPLSPIEKNSRRMRPTCEFVFAATEEAIFVHVVVSAKHIQGLPRDDVKRLLNCNAFSKDRGLPVICAPNGLRGRIIGVCPADLVKQVYFSKVKSSNGFGAPAPDMPFHFTQDSSCRSKGQTCFVEVAVGSRNVDHFPEDEKRGSLSEGFSYLNRTLIYPVEAVLLPVLYKAFEKSSPKSFWLQNQKEMTFSDVWTLWDSSGLSLSSCLGFESAAFVELMNDVSVESVLKPHQRYYSSSNSYSSSLSSISSTSSGSENVTAIRTHDLEADADSVTSTQSGLSRHEHIDSNPRKMTSKRSRAGVSESSNHLATMQQPFKSEFSVVEANSSAAMTLDGIGSYWDLADDDGDYGINIQSLLSEFGDFGDFFVNDSLCFGEPPGMAESQALILASDIGEGNDSSYSMGMDVQDQSLLPLGFSSFESLVPLTQMEEPTHKRTDNMRGVMSADVISKSSSLSKAEAMMTFAPEYAAIDMSTSEVSMPIFRNAYIPNSRKAQSSASSSVGYSYNATPPPVVEPSEENSEVLAKGSSPVLSSSYYTQVQIGSKPYSKSIVHIDDETPSSISGISSSLSHGKKTESILESDDVFLTHKSSLVTDVDCMMLQASMCKVRHTLLSFVKQNSNSLAKISGNRNDLRRKDSIPVRIAGDIDGRTVEKPVNSPVGVWRTVGATKGMKSQNIMKGDSALSSLHNTPVEESASVPVQAHPLQLLLDALPLVVQQSTSFVDIALDSYDGEEPYLWLALKEQQRRGFSCGPVMAHAGCGGLLAACHSMDIAGVDLNDPLSADVHSSFVTSFLQSDIKVALKNAFANLEGPLSLTDWCKGRNQANDSSAINDPIDNIGNDMRDSSSINIRGESISPPQALSVSSSLLKDKTVIDESPQRRTYQEASNPELERLNNSSRWATISLIPNPSFLVGYQDDWLKTSSSSIELWEKGPLEPYALPKPITYYAICPDIGLLSSAATDFFLQLGTVYETCKLGTHMPHGNGGQMDQTSGRTSGLVLMECPQSLKTTSNNISSLSSVSDFFIALESSWDIQSYLKSLAKTLKNLKLTSSSGISHKEIKGGSCMVVYVVCPFPETTAILQTIVEASTALGSNYFSSDKNRRSYLHTQVTKALSCSSSSDEASISNVFTLSGFNISKLVLQIITVDSLLRIKPDNELAMLKEYAFTVYNKARRIPRSFPGGGTLWKENIDSRWDGSSWQTLRSLDGSLPQQEEARFLFEPLFILAEPSSVEQGVSNLTSQREDLSTGGGSSGGLLEEEGKVASLHCCYGWTEDWRWLVCIWTDSRGELLDSQVIPFGGISGRQDTKFLQSIFVQILHHGCHILSWSSSDSGAFRPRDLVISRVGSFFELERQEWQKAIYLLGGNEVKKWGVQLRAGGSSSMQQESGGGMAERALPSSPSPLYSPHTKMGYMKTGSSTQVNAKKPLLLQFVQSISLVAALVDHSLQLLLPAADPPSSGYVEGFSPVKSLGAIPGAYIMIPSLNLHHLPTTPLQLPTILTSESPPLAHLLHSKGPSIPLTSAFVVSKSTGSPSEEWPSILLVSLVDHYSNSQDSKLHHFKQTDRISVLETVAAEFHSLSWLTVSPLHPQRRTQLPFHCDMLLRLRRLLYYVEGEFLSQPSDSLSP